MEATLYLAEKRGEVEVAQEVQQRLQALRS